MPNSNTPNSSNAEISEKDFKAFMERNKNYSGLTDGMRISDIQIISRFSDAQQQQFDEMTKANAEKKKKFEKNLQNKQENDLKLKEYKDLNEEEIREVKREREDYKKKSEEQAEKANEKIANNVEKGHNVHLDGYNSYHNNQKKQILDRIKNNSSLEKLVIRSTLHTMFKPITTKDIEDIATALKNHPSLKKLDLSGNNVQPEGLKKLQKIMIDGATKSIPEIDLSNNPNLTKAHIDEFNKKIEQKNKEFAEKEQNIHYTPPEQTVLQTSGQEDVQLSNDIKQFYKDIQEEAVRIRQAMLKQPSKEQNNYFVDEIKKFVRDHKFVQDITEKLPQANKQDLAQPIENFAKDLRHETSPKGFWEKLARFARDVKDVVTNAFNKTAKDDRQKIYVEKIVVRFETVAENKLRETNHTVGSLGSGESYKSSDTPRVDRNSNVNKAHGMYRNSGGTQL